jgi:transcription-repair coupling factor (superfamily II helicase)
MGCWFFHRFWESIVIMANGEILSLTQLLSRDAAFAEAVGKLWSGQSISVDGVVGSSFALAVAVIVQAGNLPVLIIVPKDEVEQVCGDIELFMSIANGLPACQAVADKPAIIKSVNLIFPVFEWAKAELGKSDESLALADDFFGQRIRVLKYLSARIDSQQPRQSEDSNKFQRLGNDFTCLTIVTSMEALVQSVPPLGLLRERTRMLMVGGRVDLEGLRRFLIEGGYHNTSAVDLPGEFAVRGYILDIFASDWEQPVRVEFFGDEIESIRRFDVTTQRSFESIAEIDLTRILPAESAGASLLDYLPQQSPILLLEPQKMFRPDNLCPERATE